MCEHQWRDDDVDGVQVVRRPAVVSVRVQPLLPAAAASAVDDADSHLRAHGHRAQSPLPQLRLRQQDLLRLLRTGDTGRHSAAVQATPAAGRRVRPTPARHRHVTQGSHTVKMTSYGHVERKRRR